MEVVFASYRTGDGEIFMVLLVTIAQRRIPSIDTATVTCHFLGRYLKDQLCTYEVRRKSAPKPHSAVVFNRCSFKKHFYHTMSVKYCINGLGLVKFWDAEAIRPIFPSWSPPFWRWRENHLYYTE